MTDNNPLRQFFRRPSVFLNLPSGGKEYGPDILERSETNEYPVYPMTAIDEITSKTPDALFNGEAVASIIKSCVPAIKDPWKITSVDLDAILIAVKSSSSGDGLDLNSKCPKCNEESTYSISLVGLLQTLKPGEYDKMLELGDLKIKFQPLTFSEINRANLAQFEMQKSMAVLQKMTDENEKVRISKELLEKVTFLTMDILSKTIESIHTPQQTVTENGYILEYLKNCDKNVFATIREYNASLKKSSELKPLEIKCASCEHEYTQPFTLNPSDFFE